jgi:hypothetical protein
MATSESDINGLSNAVVYSTASVSAVMGTTSATGSAVSAVLYEPNNSTVVCSSDPYQHLNPAYINAHRGSRAAESTINEQVSGINSIVSSMNEIHYNNYPQHGVPLYVSPLNFSPQYRSLAQQNLVPPSAAANLSLIDSTILPRDLFSTANFPSTNANLHVSGMNANSNHSNYVPQQFGLPNIPPPAPRANQTSCSFNFPPPGFGSGPISSTFAQPSNVNLGYTLPIPTDPFQDMANESIGHLHNRGNFTKIHVLSRDYTIVRPFRAAQIDDRTPPEFIQEIANRIFSQCPEVEWIDRFINLLKGSAITSPLAECFLNSRERNVSEAIAAFLREFWGLEIQTEKMMEFKRISYPEHPGQTMNMFVTKWYRVLGAIRIEINSDPIQSIIFKLPDKVASYLWSCKNESLSELCSNVNKFISMNPNAERSASREKFLEMPTKGQNPNLHVQKPAHPDRVHQVESSRNIAPESGNIIKISNVFYTRRKDEVVNPEFIKWHNFICLGDSSMVKFLKNIVDYWYERDGSKPLLNQRLPPHKFLQQLKVRHNLDKSNFKNVLLFLGQDIIKDTSPMKPFRNIYSKIVEELITRFGTKRIVFLSMLIPFNCKDDEILQRVQNLNGILFGLKQQYPDIVDIFNPSSILYTNFKCIPKLKHVKDLHYRFDAFVTDSKSDLFEWHHRSADELSRRLDLRLSKISEKKTVETVSAVTEYNDDCTKMLMHFGQTKTFAQIDTGCRYNLMSERMYLKIKDDIPNLSLTPSDNIRLEAAGQTDLKILGKCTINSNIVCCFDQRRRINVNMEYIVIENLGTAILFGAQEIKKKDILIYLNKSVLIFQNTAVPIPIGLRDIDRDPRMYLNTIQPRSRKKATNIDPTCPIQVLNSRHITSKGNIVNLVISGINKDRSNLNLIAENNSWKPNEKDVHNMYNTSMNPDIEDICEVLKFGNIDENLKKELCSIVKKHLFVFRKQAGRLNNFEFKFSINTKNAIKSKLWSIPRFKEKLLDQKMNEWINNGMVEPSSGPHLNNLVLVSKGPNEVRPCIDGRLISKYITSPSYRVQKIPDLISQVQHGKYFTRLDFSQAFMQIQLAEECRDITTFMWKNKCWRFTVVPYGLSNSMQGFLMGLSRVLQGCESFTISYIDDCLIYSDNLEDHKHHVDLVLDRIKKSGMSLNLKKCSFAEKEIDFLGFHILEEGVIPKDRGIKKVLEKKIPKSVKDVQSLLGAANFFRSHIPGLADLSTTLTQLTKKNSSWEWSEKHQKAFDEIRDRLASNVCNHHPNSSFPFHLMVHTDDNSYSAVIFQEIHDDNKIVALWGRTWRDTEKNWSLVEKELKA